MNAAFIFIILKKSDDLMIFYHELIAATALQLGKTRKVWHNTAAI